MRTGVNVAPAASSQTLLSVDALATDKGLVILGAAGVGIPDGAKITAVDPGVSYTIDQAATAGDGAATVAVDLTSRKGTAYGATSVFDDEAIVVLSEIDTGLNTSANPAAFDMRASAGFLGLDMRRGG